MTTTYIKVDTDAIKRNGMLPKDGTAKHEPAIIVLTVDNRGTIISEERAHAVDIYGHVVFRQDDDNPGAIGLDHRGARVWAELPSLDGYGEGITLD